MIYRLLADTLVVLHFGFLLFVILGGVLVARYPRIAWLHLPAALWGALIELAGGVCPLTPWEQALRRQAGQAGYSEGFIEHYLIPVLYPAGLTPPIQLALGAMVIAVNGGVYAWLWQRRRAARAR